MQKVFCIRGISTCIVLAYLPCGFPFTCAGQLNYVALANSCPAHEASTYHSSLINREKNPLVLVVKIVCISCDSQLPSFYLSEDVLTGC